MSTRVTNMEEPRKDYGSHSKPLQTDSARKEYSLAKGEEI
jgi:hypothetical protein